MSSKKRIVIGADGYFSTNSPLSVPSGALVSPSRNMIYRENGVLESFGGFGSLGDLGDERIYALEDGWGSLGAGNVIESFGRSLIFAGGGTLKVLMPLINAVLQVVGSASSIPQIAVLNGSGNGYLAPKQMGLSPQGTAPLLSEPSVLGTGLTGKITGSISAQIARRRSETGAISISSPSSNIIELTAKSVLVQIPTAPADGTSHWRLYFTEHGGGSLGNYLQFPVELSESQVAAGTVNATYGNAVVRSTGVARVVEVEYEDADLLPLKPPTAFFPAEACDYVEKLGNHTLLLGTHGGLGIWPSHGDNPEAFDPLDVQFLPEPIVGVLKPHDGYLWVLCRNSIHLVMLSGGVQSSPILIRPVYDRKGVKNGKAAVTVGDELYFLTAGGLACRINADGAYDDSFSLKVRGFMSTFDSASTVLSYDENSNVVLFCNTNLVQCYHINEDFWSPPIYTNECIAPNSPAGAVRSSFVQEGAAHLVYLNGSTYQMWLFDVAGAGSNWIVQTAKQGFEEPLVWKDIIGATVVYNRGNAGTLAAMNLLGYKGVNHTFNITTLGSNNTDFTSDWIPLNVTDFKQTAFAANGLGRGFRLYGVEVDVVYHRSR